MEERGEGREEERREGEETVRGGRREVEGRSEGREEEKGGEQGEGVDASPLDSWTYG